MPPHLYSHRDQQSQWQTGTVDKVFQGGWAARISELMNDAFNGNGQVSMNISLDGLNNFQRGNANAVNQYTMQPTGASSLSGYGTQYSSAIDTNGAYKDTPEGRRLKAFDQIAAYTNGNCFGQAFNSITRRARVNEQLIYQTLENADASSVDYDALFANAQTDLGNELKAIAKLIAGREELGNRRQVFFCIRDGYDTHSYQNQSMVESAGDLAQSMNAFNAAMTALGTNNDVVTFTASEFNRAMTPNRDDPVIAGTDHGWGGHQIVMGGPVNGQNVYGEFQSLEINAGRDAGTTRGQWIPTTSIDQFAAVLAKWFGVGSSELELIFPNLSRFNDPFSTSAHLEFL